MKKLGNILLLVLLIAFVGILVGYGVRNSFDYSELLALLVTADNSFLLGFVNHILSFINPLTLGLRLYIYAGVLGLGVLIGLFILIRLLKQGRIVKASIGFVSPLIVASLGIAFVTPNFYGSGKAFYVYLLTQLSESLSNLAFLGSLTILPVLFFGIVTLQGLFSTGHGKSKVVVKKVKKVVKQKVDQPTSVQPLNAPVSPMLSVPPTSISTAPAPASSTDVQLTELVKLVLAEELNTPRQSVYGQFAPAVDANVVRRIVAEELAKFQTHFMTRAEAQTMVAQEVAALKQQLKIK